MDNRMFDTRGASELKNLSLEQVFEKNEDPMIS